MACDTSKETNQGAGRGRGSGKEIGRMKVLGGRKREVDDGGFEAGEKRK